MINTRALIITGILFFVMIILILKLFTIQINKHEYYARIAETQQYKPQPVKADRGLINDINGEVLSYTFDNVSFYVDRAMMYAKPERIDSVASAFEKIMGKTKEYYKKLIAEGERTVYLEKKVPMEQAIQLKRITIDGLKYKEDFSRIYPYGNSACHILGFVDKDGIGVEGLEKLLNDEMKGEDGYYVYERDVLGRVLSVNEDLSKLPVAGNNITLTINKNYQKILEEEIAAGLRKYGGQSSVGIIMNPNTGEILALANAPDFDPANYSQADPNSRKNRAVTDTYEPGSTMKALSMSILLDNNLVNEKEVVNTENGKYLYKGVPIFDTHGFSELTVRQVLEQSSNVGMAKLSERIDEEQFYKYLRDFGLSNKTMIDLPSESSGMMKIPKNFTKITKAFMSYGYEIAVTPIQLAAAYSAVINGGTLYQPFIVKRVTDAAGKVIRENQPTKIRNVIKQSTSDLMRDMMVGVVEKGTGTEARLDDVMIGGKTGTAQRLVNNSYSSSHHNSSFVGFFPADKPNILILILVDSPTKGQYGGLVAAPIFHEVAKRLVESDVNLVPKKEKLNRTDELMNQLMTDINKKPNNQKSYLDKPELSGEYSSRRFFNQSTMPNLVQKSMRDAIAQLNEMGMKCKVEGSGKVVWQNIEPGLPFNKDVLCTLRCEPINKKIKLPVSQ